MLKNSKLRKAISSLTRIGGLSLTLYGLVYAKGEYELLYSFAGGGDALYSEEGVNMMPDSITAYLILIVAGIFIAFYGASLGETKDDPNKALEENDAKNARIN